MQLFLVAGVSLLTHYFTIVLFSSILPYIYPKDKRCVRLTYAFHEGISSLVSTILGVILIYDKENYLTQPGVWECILLPSFLLDLILILSNKDGFHPKFTSFIFGHHAMAILLIVILLFLGLINYDPINLMVPYIFIWNGATILTCIDLYFYMHNLILYGNANKMSNYYLSLFAIIGQRIWRIWIIIKMFIEIPKTFSSMFVCYFGGLLFEFYDIPQQIKTIKSAFSSLIAN
jgi:hypothetical protein